MSWIQRYRFRYYVTNALWILPVLSMVLALGVVRLLHTIETALGWQSSLEPAAAQVILGTMASAMFTFIVFVSSALLVAMQLASSQLTPRILGIVFRDSVTRYCLVTFVFSFTLTLATLVLVGAAVPPLTGYVAAYSCLASLAAFLYLIDHVGKMLRPSGALRAVAVQGRKVITSVYPRRLGQAPHLTTDSSLAVTGIPSRTILNVKDGVVLAFDVTGLTGQAVRADCVIELVPQVGDFVGVGDPLFRIHHGGATLSEHALRDSVAVGQERTMTQDPAFVFRIMVDIATKGLSPAINDPTTAVLALDQIHHLLRIVGERSLDDERVRDKSGRIRLLYRTPDWVDFVQLAVTEIRQFGGTSIQIARRMRAMLEQLSGVLPEERARLLRHELQLLQRSVKRAFVEPEDLALADVGDSQGFGGKLRNGQTAPGEQAAS